MKRLAVLLLSVSLLDCSTVETKVMKPTEEFYDGRFDIVYYDFNIDGSNDEVKVLLDKKTKVKYLVYKNGGTSGGIGIVPLVEEE